MTAIEVRPPRDDAEYASLADLTFQSFAGFGGPFDWTHRWFELVGRENLRVAVRDGRVVAGLALLYFGQWYGGRVVESSGISAVGVAPDCRAERVGFALLSAVLRELRAEGVALCALYPSTLRFYRSLGFEVAGYRMTHKLSARALRPRCTPLVVREMSPADEPRVHALYKSLARRDAGVVCRRERQWHRILHLRDEFIYRYVVVHPAHPETLLGYVVYRQNGTGGFPYRLLLRDYRFATADAGQRLLQFFADHASIADVIEWDGGPGDPLLLAADVNSMSVDNHGFLMLRVLDVEKAIAQRGFPPEISGAVQVTLDDALLTENSGRYTIRVRDGRGEAIREPVAGDAAEQDGTGAVAASDVSAGAPDERTAGVGGLGEGTVGVGALAAAYAGFGWPSPNESTQAARLVRLFAGPTPWINDRF